MKVSKPINLFIPKKVKADLGDYLKSNPPNFKYDIVYFYYVFDYLIKTQRVFKKEQENTFINIKNVRSQIVANIDKYLNYLKNGEFIISDETYIVGTKSKGYKINDKYCLDEFEQIELNPNHKLFKKTIKKQNLNKSHYNRLEPFLYEMLKLFKSIEINRLQALKWINYESLKDNRLIYYMMLENFHDKRFRYFKRNKTNNRLDTNLTNLKSELRQFIKGDYTSIDLKNSQPFFLSILLINLIKNNRTNRCCMLDLNNIVKTFGNKAIKNILKIRQNKENAFLANLKSFYNEVLTGNLYEYFKENYKDEILTRKQIKEIMFKVLFSSNACIKNGRIFYPFKKEKEAFASVYPFVIETIEILKSKDNSILPIYLQKIESYIFIDCISKRLVENGIIPLTIHDSVIVPTNKVNETMSLIKDVFNEYFNCIPVFDIKKLNQNNLKESESAHL